MKLLQLTLLLLFSFAISAQQDSDKPSLLKDQVIADDLIVDGNGCIGNGCINGENFDSKTLILKEDNLRLRFTDASGTASFPSNDWEITINETTNGGANYFAISDITAGRIPFRINAGAPANSLIVHHNGNIGVGTSNPVVEAHIVDGNTPTLRLENDNSSGFTPQTWDVAGNEANFFIRDVTNGGELPFRIRPSSPENSIDIHPTFIGLYGETEAFAKVVIRNVDNSGTAFQVNGNGLITGEFEALSDERFKKNITPLTSSSGLLTMLKAVSYDMKTEEMPQISFASGKQYGFLAQDMEKILPDLVSQQLKVEGVGYKSINYIQLIPFMVSAFQEQENKISLLTKEVESLRKAIEGILKEGRSEK